MNTHDEGTSGRLLGSRALLGNNYTTTILYLLGNHHPW